MTGRDWKPGQPIPVGGHTVTFTWNQVAIDHMLRVLEAEYPAAHKSMLENVTRAINARPLVVIDPENRDHVVDIAAAFNATGSPQLGAAFIDRLQAALRSLANPRPAEPTDPHARVTDRRDNIWRLLADGDWVSTSGPDIGEYLTWERLASERGPLTVEAVQP